MKVHVILSNRFEPAEIAEVKLKNCICAVIDTIRATSTIVILIGCGAEKVIVAADKKEAFFLKTVFKGSILCGEEKGLPPKGFDFGNSPLEISSADLNGRTFIIMTTNGTQSILKAKQCRKVYALSTLNLNFCIDRIAEKSQESNSDILLVCSGEKGKIAYDDAYTAGLAVKYLLTKPYKLEFTDAAKLVLAASLSETNTEDALEKSCSAKSLRAAGLGSDIAFISQLNSFKVAPLIYIQKFKTGTSEKYPESSAKFSALKSGSLPDQIKSIVIMR